MNVMRSRHCLLALAAVGAAGCSDRPASTAPVAAQPQSRLPESAPVALLAPGDPTGIPIGSPGLVEFLGGRGVVRHVIAFPQSPPKVDAAELERTARNWLARNASLKHDRSDPRTSRAIETIERIFAARSPQERRVALGLVSGRAGSKRSIQPIAGGLFEHTATFHLDGRELLRVLTRAGPGGRPSFECIEPPETLDYTDERCDYTSYDPYFDPEPVVAEITAMTSSLDTESADLSAYESRGVVTHLCEADRAAFTGAALAYMWKAGEAIFYAWNRNVLKTYTAVRDASFLYGTAYALLVRYKRCIAQNDSEGRV